MSGIEIVSSSDSNKPLRVHKTRIYCCIYIFFQCELALAWQHRADIVLAHTFHAWYCYMENHRMLRIRCLRVGQLMVGNCLQRIWCCWLRFLHLSRQKKQQLQMANQHVACRHLNRSWEHWLLFHQHGQRMTKARHHWERCFLSSTWQIWKRCLVLRKVRRERVFFVPDHTLDATLDGSTCQKLVATCFGCLDEAHTKESVRECNGVILH